MGVDIAHLEIRDGEPFNSRGSLTYNSGGDCSAIGLPTCTGLANFIDDFSGAGGIASKQFGVSQVNFTQFQQAYYPRTPGNSVPTSLSPTACATNTRARLSTCCPFQP